MKRSRYRIPSTSALQAFESAARHCNFSRAAEELCTSQSAISRHIATLESRLNVTLFDRSHKKRLALTHAGAQLYRAVVSGFDSIQNTLDAISGLSEQEQLTIACTHEVSHLYLLPRFDDLQQALGGNCHVRIMTYEYDIMEIALDPQIDIVIQYDVTKVDPHDRVAIIGEAIIPLASPGFVEQHRELLQQDISEWKSLSFLELSKQNYGWATWDDWMQQVGHPGLDPEFTYFNNYVYLLEAAAVGKGLALGWRGMIERHIANGALLPLTQSYVEYDRAIYAVLTGHGRNKTLSRQCMAYLASLKL